MRTALHALIAIGAGVVAAVIALVTTVWLSVATDPCDTTKYVCDAAVYGGIGLGALVGVAAFLFVSAWMFRYLRRRARTRPAA